MAGRLEDDAAAPAPDGPGDPLQPDVAGALRREVAHQPVDEPSPSMSPLKRCVPVAWVTRRPSPVSSIGVSAPGWTSNVPVAVVISHTSVLSRVDHDEPDRLCRRTVTPLRGSATGAPPGCAVIARTVSFRTEEMH